MIFNYKRRGAKVFYRAVSEYENGARLVVDGVLYDAAHWTDGKIEKAIREAVKDSFPKVKDNAGKN